MAKKNIQRSKIKIGLIGAGNWGMNYIRTINEINYIELVGILKITQLIPSDIKYNCKVLTII